MNLKFRLVEYRRVIYQLGLEGDIVDAHFNVLDRLLLDHPRQLGGL
jgi:hypothetical protein